MKLLLGPAPLSNSKNWLLPPLGCTYNSPL